MGGRGIRRAAQGGLQVDLDRPAGAPENPHTTSADPAVPSSRSAAEAEVRAMEERLEVARRRLQELSKDPAEGVDR